MKQTLTKIQEKLKIPDKYEEITSIIFKVLFLTIGFMQTCNITFGHKIISVVLWPTVFLGIIILIYRMIHIDRYYKSKGLILLVLFTLSFFISTILFRKYGIYENIRSMAWMIYQFGILYAYDLGKEPAYYKKQIKIIFNIFIIVMAVLSIISFVEMACNYSAYIDKKGEPDLVYGFTWGRLFGAYWDPNIAAVMATIAILISIYYFTQTDKKGFKVAHILNIILQASYIAFSDSRTGKICLIAGAVTTAIIYFILNHKEGMKKAGIGVLALVIIGISPALIKRVYNFGMSLIPTNPEQTTTKTNIGREGDINGDISNRRFDIWGSALEIAKENPVFGVSRKNIIPYAKDVNPNLYIVHNDHMDFDSMHDLFLDILASQGVVGIILFYGFGILVIVTFIKSAKKIKEKDGNELLFSVPIVVSTLVSTLVMTELVYVDSPISTVFWMLISYLMCYTQTLRKEK